MRQPPCNSMHLLASVPLTIPNHRDTNLKSLQSLCPALTLLFAHNYIQQQGVSFPLFCTPQPKLWSRLSGPDVRGLQPVLRRQKAKTADAEVPRFSSCVKGVSQFELWVWKEHTWGFCQVQFAPAGLGFIEGLMSWSCRRLPWTWRKGLSRVNEVRKYIQELHFSTVSSICLSSFEFLEVKLAVSCSCAYRLYNVTCALRFLLYHFSLCATRCKLNASHWKCRNCVAVHLLRTRGAMVLQMEIFISHSHGWLRRHCMSLLNFSWFLRYDTLNCTAWLVAEDIVIDQGRVVSH